MKYLQFDKDGILTLVSKTRVKQDDLEVEDSYNFQKEKEVDLNDEKVTILVDKTKEEILEELYPKLSDEALAKLEADKLQAELKAKRESDEEYRIQSIKLTAQSLILQKYPLEKQSSANLGLYGEEYLAEMKAYIANIIRISNEAEVNGTKLEDVLWQ